MSIRRQAVTTTILRIVHQERREIFAKSHQRYRNDLCSNFCKSVYNFYLLKIINSAPNSPS